VLGRLRYEIGRRRPRNQPHPTAYTRFLLTLLHEHLSDEYPDTLGRDEFVERSEERLGFTETSRVSAHLADLWALFAPDFRDRLPEFYRALELPNLLRYIDYTCDEQFIVNSYVAPYELACDQLGSLHVLEIGGGIPHGLIRLQSVRPGIIASASLNDVDALYSRFAIWFCERERISSEWIPAVAGQASALPTNRFNFIFAKDVLEHLHDPEAMLEQIVRAATPEAILALDLGDKGPRVHQHVTPDLTPLEAVLRTRGWNAVAIRGSMTMLRQS
jgi:SAM-dependent methyltransferase